LINFSQFFVGSQQEHINCGAKLPVAVIFHNLKENRKRINDEVYFVFWLLGLINCNSITAVFRQCHHSRWPDMCARSHNFHSES